MAAPEPVGAERLASYWRKIERRVASQRALMAHIMGRLLGDDAGAPLLDVRERDVPGQLVLAERRHVPVDQLSAWIGAAMGRLLQAARRYGGASGSPFVVYHGEINEDSDGPVEACVPIRLASRRSTNTGMREEPAHREAYVRLRKAQVEFPQILSVYDGVARWLESRGLAASAPPREVYFTDFRSAGPDDEVCDVAFPIDSGEPGSC